MAYGSNMSNLANIQAESELEKIENDPQQDQQTNPYETDVSNFTAAAIDLLPDEVDTVAETEADARAAAERARQRGARERSRYGIQQTAAEREQTNRLGQLQTQASIAGARTQAIRSDDVINRNIGNVALNLLSQNYQSALSSLLGLGDIDVARKNAYANAKARSRSQHYGFLGGVGRAVGSFLGGKI